MQICIRSKNALYASSVPQHAQDEVDHLPSIVRGHLGPFHLLQVVYIRNLPRVGDEALGGSHALLGNDDGFQESDPNLVEDRSRAERPAEQYYGGGAIPYGCPANPAGIVRSVVAVRRHRGWMAAVRVRLGEVPRCAAHEAADGC